jgi:hypothetical protein
MVACARCSPVRRVPPGPTLRWCLTHVLAITHRSCKTHRRPRTAGSPAHHPDHRVPQPSRPRLTVRQVPRRGCSRTAKKQAGQVGHASAIAVEVDPMLACAGQAPVRPDRRAGQVRRGLNRARSGPSQPTGAASPSRTDARSLRSHVMGARPERGLRPSWLVRRPAEDSLEQQGGRMTPKAARTPGIHAISIGLQRTGGVRVISTAAAASLGMR